MGLCNILYKSKRRKLSLKERGGEYCHARVTSGVLHAVQHQKLKIVEFANSIYPDEAARYDELSQLNLC